MPTKFPSQNVKEYFSHEPAGKVTTSTITIHCDVLHVNFMNKYTTPYYKESDSNDKFVPNSMFPGVDQVKKKSRIGATFFGRVQAGAF
jgi:hypothetical protein